LRVTKVKQKIQKNRVQKKTKIVTELLLKTKIFAVKAKFVAKNYNCFNGKMTTICSLKTYKMTNNFGGQNDINFWCKKWQKFWLKKWQKIK